MTLGAEKLGAHLLLYDIRSSCMYLCPLVYIKWIQCLHTQVDQLGVLIAMNRVPSLPAWTITYYLKYAKVVAELQVEQTGGGLLLILPFSFVLQQDNVCS